MRSEPGESSTANPLTGLSVAVLLFVLLLLSTGICLLSLATSRVAVPGAATTSQAETPGRCGRSGQLYLLLLGADSRTGELSDGFADFIRVARIDYDRAEISVLAIPRDLVLRIPGLEGQGIYEDRIRMAFAYGYQYGWPGGGAGLLRETLVSQLDMPVDEVVVVNFMALEQGIDALGGVEMLVEAKEMGLEPGLQRLSGAQALAYARLRQAAENPSDLERIDRQSALLRAIFAQAREPGNLERWPELYASLASNSESSLSTAETSSLLCLGRLLDDDSIHFLDVPVNALTRQIDGFGQEMFVADRAALRAAVAQFEGGTASAGSE